MFELKQLRQERGLKRSELARELNMNQNTLANYENAVREAPYDVLIKFADYFDVTLDELLGRADRGGESVAKNIEEEQILYKYRKLPQRDRERVQDYIKVLSERN